MTKVCENFRIDIEMNIGLVSIFLFLLILL